MIPNLALCAFFQLRMIPEISWVSGIRKHLANIFILWNDNFSAQNRHRECKLVSLELSRYELNTEAKCPTTILSTAGGVGTVSSFAHRGRGSDTTLGIWWKFLYYLLWPISQSLSGFYLCISHEKGHKGWLLREMSEVRRKLNKTPQDWLIFIQKYIA